MAALARLLQAGARRQPALATSASRCTASFYPPITEDLGRVQPAYPTEVSPSDVQYHDSLQYHFFFPGLFVAGRVFQTKTLQQHSAWMYDVSTGKVEELFDPSYDILSRSSSGLALDGKELSITDGSDGGSFVARARGLKVNFQQRRVFEWLPAGQTDNAVIHRPDLLCTLELDGKTLQGTGYSKRYYGSYQRYWGYRFIHSCLSPVGGDPAQQSFLWNADAAFGDNKYNYFKLVSADGQLLSANTADTWQQDTSGYALMDDGSRYEVRINPLCTWETIIGGEGRNMDSKMQNRYCESELLVNGKVVLQGVAYNERCYGTIG